MAFAAFASDYERVMSHVQPLDSGHWLWTATIHANGYGKCRLGGVYTTAHRAVWTILRGPVDPKLELDHLCRVRWCVNPDHLEPVTPRENTMRGQTLARANAERTECINGHAFTSENTWVSPKTGRRSCRACNRIRQYRRNHPEE